MTHSSVAPPRELLVVGAAWIRDGRCLVGLRPPGGSAGNKWEFPGGKVEPGESPEGALLRELREELGVEVQVESYVGRGTQDVGTTRILLDVYFVSAPEGEPEAREHQALRWVSAEEVPTLDWAPADVPLLPALIQRLRASANESQVSSSEPIPSP